jgi:hypothetical protein
MEEVPHSQEATEIEEAPAASAVPPPLPLDERHHPRTGNKTRLLNAIMLILAGMLALFAITLYEEQWIDQLPWGHALAGPVVGTLPPEAIPALVRPVPLENFPDQQAAIEALETMLRADGAATSQSLGMNRTESVMLMAVPEEDLEGMLLEGRLPEPGKPEVLAGDLCRINSFKLDQFTFTVTGRLRPGVGVLTFSYLLPEHPAWQMLFENADDKLNAWVLPEGKLDTVDALVSTGMLKAEEAEDSDARSKAQDAMMVYEGTHLHMMNRTEPMLALGIVIVLGLMLLGTCIATTEALLLWRTRAPQFLRGLCEEPARNPRGWYAMHMIGYGAFVVTMLAGLTDPVSNLRMMDFVRGMFSDGDLAYIGEAYLSGDIIAAANATWMNNYVVQTLGMTLLPSIIPLALGMFKTLASLAVVGFAMAPAWMGMSATLIFHSGTMVLELEPYIIAAYVSALWPVWFIKGLRDGNLWSRTRQWLGLAIAIALLAGVVLYAAGLYEGATLIMFGNLGG